MGKKLIIKGADFSEYAVGASSSGGTKVTILFDTNGIGNQPYMRVDKGSTVELPTPEKEGYEFMGWYRDSAYIESIEESITASSNMTLYAKWQSVETILYNESDWTPGRYWNTTNMATEGAAISSVGNAAATRCVSKRFEIASGQTFELVTRIQSPSDAMAYFGATNNPITKVVLARDSTTNLIETPFVYTAAEDLYLYVNLGNGIDKTSGNYDESIDYREDFYLKVKTPIAYGEGED